MFDIQSTPDNNNDDTMNFEQFIEQTNRRHFFFFFSFTFFLLKFKSRKLISTYVSHDNNSNNDNKVYMKIKTEKRLFSCK